MTHNTLVLEAVDLEKRFAKDQAAVFSKLSLQVHDGEIVSILGMSGVGKTTLFNLLAGLDKPDQGQIHVHKQLSYMFQKDLLLPWKKIIDNISLPLVIKGKRKQEARLEAAQYLEAFGLEGLELRYPDQISGGERRRAALLRTYLAGGEILLLDEPFTGLDQVTRLELQDWLKNLVKEIGLTLVLISHDLHETIRISDTIYVMLSGRPAQLSEAIEIEPDNTEATLAKIMCLLYKEGKEKGKENR